MDDAHLFHIEGTNIYTYYSYHEGETKDFWKKTLEIWHKLLYFSFVPKTHFIKTFLLQKQKVSIFHIYIFKLWHFWKLE